LSLRHKTRWGLAEEKTKGEKKKSTGRNIVHKKMGEQGQGPNAKGTGSRPAYRPVLHRGKSHVESMPAGDVNGVERGKKREKGPKRFLSRGEKVHFANMRKGGNKVPNEKKDSQPSPQESKGSMGTRI